MSDYADNLMAVYQRADSEDKRNGKLWYPQARGNLFSLGKRYGYSLKRMAYAAAALSNNMEWNANLALTEQVVWSLRYNRKVTGHYRHCLNKAVAILKHGKFDALSGPKVVPFGQALMGDTTAAVIDRHMWRAAGGQGSLTLNRSADCAIALREVAKLVKKPVTEVQAIIWIVQRRNDDPLQEPIPF